MENKEIEKRMKSLDELTTKLYNLAESIAFDYEDFMKDLVPAAELKGMKKKEREAYLRGKAEKQFPKLVGELKALNLGFSGITLWADDVRQELERQSGILEEIEQMKEEIEEKKQELDVQF